MKNLINETMMQYFEWNLKPDCSLWNMVTSKASFLSSIGITSIWLPPAYKATQGINDTGYGVYDLYDLGEFNQKGTIPTKYGTKDEYVQAIKTLRANYIKVYADVVLNHKMGADETEHVIAYEQDHNDRTKTLTEPITIKAWTKYSFAGREDKYSDFKWNWTHFTGVDWDENTKRSSVFQFYGKHWDNHVDKEKGNFDYLMGADVDLNNVDVVKEFISWGKWYLSTTNVDGFRLDAVKHIDSSFFEEWVSELRASTGKSLDVFGEYWSNNIDALNNYIKETKSQISLFDVPLHYNFFKASYSNGEFDMRTIFDGTLVEEHPELAITFVNNHDTQPGQSLESWVPEWFKPLAYSLILLRKDGTPCIFYGDYYGIPFSQIPSSETILNLLIKIRKYFAYGRQVDYFNDRNIIAWVREGDFEHPDSGLVAILSDSVGGSKQINVGSNLANKVLYDCTGNIKEEILTDSNGNATFYCNGGSVSIWILKHNMYLN